MDYLDYREKLGIGFNSDSKCEYFMVRMDNILEEIPWDAVKLNDAFVYKYYNEIGINIESTNDRQFDTIIRVIRRSLNFKVFLARYIIFTNMIKSKNKGKYNYKFFKNTIEENLRAAHIQYEIITDKDGYFLFPKGAQELDEALVSEPLYWLESYPQAHKSFVKALRAYSEASTESASDVADQFRKALETFMQEFFGCDKSLENCKALYGEYLKGHGVPKEISGNLESLLQLYTNFMNTYAKHHDKTQINVLEYIMYQTGNVVRLLVTTKIEEEVK